MTMHAEIIVRHKYIDSIHNDLGFQRQANGTYKLLIDQSGRFGSDWIGHLKQQYARANLHRQAKAQGYRVVEEEDEDGSIRIKMDVD